MQKPSIPVQSPENLKEFVREFVESEEPQTDLMIDLGEGEYLRTSNLDFLNKNYIFVN